MINKLRYDELFTFGKGKKQKMKLFSLIQHPKLIPDFRDYRQTCEWLLGWILSWHPRISVAKYD